MGRLFRILCAVIAITAIGSAGCDTSSTTSSTTETSQESQSAPAASPDPDKKPAPQDRPDTETESKAPVPRTADAAARAVLEGIRHNRPVAVWTFLPASYQRDVNDLVHEFARRMDPELWQRGIASLRAIVDLLKDRQELFLARSQPADDQAGPHKPANESAAWEGLLELLQTLLNSELSDLEALQQLDVGAFLAGTGSRVMEQLAAVSRLHPEDPYQQAVRRQLADVEVTLLASEGETATVRITAPDRAAEPQKVEFVRVEGKWIPRSLAEGWQPAMEKLRHRVETLTPERMEQIRQRSLPALDRLDAVVVELREAETPEEFRNLFARKVLEPFNAALPVQRPAAQRPNGKSGGRTGSGREQSDRPDTVTVVLKKTPEGDRDRWLAERLRQASDDPGNMTLVGPLQTGSETRYELAPVGRLETFVSRIDFAEVLEVDAEKRSVLLRLRSGANGGAGSEKPAPSDRR